MIKSVDLRQPHQWFPMARALQRRWVGGSLAGWVHLCTAYLRVSANWVRQLKV